MAESTEKILGNGNRIPLPDRPDCRVFNRSIFMSKAWWEKELDHAAQQERRYESRRNGTSLSDYLDNWGSSRGSYGGGYGGWTSVAKADESTVEKDRLKRTVAKNLNVLDNSVSGERSLKLGFATDGAVNDVESDTVYMPADIFTNTESTGEATDIMSGLAMIASTMKRTVHPRAARQAKPFNRERSKAKYIWEAMEQAVARKDVLDNWSGFTSFFDAHRDYSTTVNDEYMDDITELDARSATITAAYNLLNPIDARFMDDGRMKQIMNEAAEIMLSGKPRERFEDAQLLEKTINDLFEVEEEEEEEEGDAHTPINPVPEEEGEGEVEGGSENDKGEGDNSEEEGKGEGEGENSEEEGEGEDPLPSQADAHLFGNEMEADENDTPTDVSELVLPTIPDAGEPPCSVEWVVEDELDTSTPGKKAAVTKMSNKYKQLVDNNKDSIKAIVNSLDFLNNDPRSYVRGQKSGHLDPASLYKLSFNTDNPSVFEKQQVISGKKIAVALLVDRSGSMGNYDRAAGSGTRMDSANKVCVIMSEALKQIKGISLDIYTHYADYENYHGEKLIKSVPSKKKTANECCVVIHEYLSQQRDNTVRIPNIHQRGANYDGYAIEEVSKKLMNDYPDYDNRIVFVISDGQPHADHYSGDAAMNHVADTTSFCRSIYKIDVYGIGIADAYTEAEGTKMYGEGNNVVLGDITSSIGVMTSFLRKIATKVN